MKKTFIYLFFLLSFSYAQNISPYLQNKIITVSENEFVPITIILLKVLSLFKYTLRN